MKMQTLLRGIGLTAPVIMGMGFIAQASAGCLDVPGIKVPSANSEGSQSRLGAGRFIKTDFQEPWREEERHDAPIVGLWSFKYTSEGNLDTLGIPDGAMVDGGNTTWYADGNEFTSSGVRNPIVGTVCLGVWKRTGENTYVLNHIGLSWNPAAASVSPPADPGPASNSNPGGGPGAPGGPAFIKQHITLSRDHQSYTGTFTITQLMPDGKTPALPAPIKGKITATRVTIDTDTQVP